jgi:NADH-quinone oxidoreductase subunit C
MSHLPAIAPHDSVAKRAQALFGAHILEVREAVGELTLLVTRNSIDEVLTLLRDAPDLAFEQLMDICGADLPSAFAAAQFPGAGKAVDG